MYNPHYVEIFNAINGSFGYDQPGSSSEYSSRSGWEWAIALGGTQKELATTRPLSPPPGRVLEAANGLS